MVPPNSQAAHAHNSHGLDETVHGLLWQLKCQILTFSYWDSITLKYKIFKPAFSQNMIFFWAVTFLRAMHLIVWSLKVPVCAPHTGSCCFYQPCCHSQLFETSLSPGIVQISVGGIIVWGCPVSECCLWFLIPFLILHEDYPWADCVVTRKLRALVWIILQELVILEPKPQLKGLDYNYHSHTLHLLPIWKNVL